MLSCRASSGQVEMSVKMWVVDKRRQVKACKTEAPLKEKAWRTVSVKLQVGSACLALV